MSFSCIAPHLPNDRPAAGTVRAGKRPFRKAYRSGFPFRRIPNPQKIRRAGRRAETGILTPNRKRSVEEECLMLMSNWMFTRPARGAAQARESAAKGSVRPCNEAWGVVAENLAGYVPSAERNDIGFAARDALGTKDPVFRGAVNTILRYVESIRATERAALSGYPGGDSLARLENRWKEGVDDAAGDLLFELFDEKRAFCDFLETGVRGWIQGRMEACGASYHPGPAEKVLLGAGAIRSGGMHHECGTLAESLAQQAVTGLESEAWTRADRLADALMGRETRGIGGEDLPVLKILAGGVQSARLPGAMAEKVLEVAMAEAGLGTLDHPGDVPYPTESPRYEPFFELARGIRGALGKGGGIDTPEAFEAGGGQATRLLGAMTLLGSDRFAGMAHKSGDYASSPLETLGEVVAVLTGEVPPGNWNRTALDGSGRTLLELAAQSKEKLTDVPDEALLEEVPDSLAATGSALAGNPGAKPVWLDVFLRAQPHLTADGRYPSLAGQAAIWKGFIDRHAWIFLTDRGTTPLPDGRTPLSILAAEAASQAPLGIALAQVMGRYPDLAKKPLFGASVASFRSRAEDLAGPGYDTREARNRVAAGAGCACPAVTLVRTMDGLDLAHRTEALLVPALEALLRSIPAHSSMSLQEFEEALRMRLGEPSASPEEAEARARIMEKADEMIQRTRLAMAVSSRRGRRDLPEMDWPEGPVL
jgi:hypothetical protein